MDRFVTLVDTAFLFESLHLCHHPYEFALQDAKAFTDRIRQHSKQASGGIQHLRTYWYDGKADNQSWQNHERTAAIFRQHANVCRYGTRRFGNERGSRKEQQKRVDSLNVADLIRFAQWRSVADLVLVSGDEDLMPGVEQAQDCGVRVSLLTVRGQDNRVADDLDAIVDEHKYIDHSDLLACGKPVPGALLGEVLKAVAEALPAKRAAVSMKEVENVASERLGRPRQKGDRSTKERLLGNEWFGTGSFHALLYKLRIDGWELTSTGSFVPADPIPTPSTSPVPVRTRQGPIRAVTETHPELAGCVQKVKSANTNIPLLPPDAYAVLFQALAPRVRNDLPSGQLPPNTDGLLRAVEKDCADTPYPVDQAAVSYVLNSVTRFVRDCPEEEVQLRRSCSGSWEVAIAEYFAARVVRVCQTGGQALSSEEQDHLRLWLLGGFKRTAVVTDGVA